MSSLCEFFLFFEKNVNYSIQFWDSWILVPRTLKICEQPPSTLKWLHLTHNIHFVNNLRSKHIQFDIKFHEKIKYSMEAL